MANFATEDETRITNKVVGEDETPISYLLLKIAAELYGVRGTDVREISRWRDPVRVPGAPPALPGIINQRGVVLPVVDMRFLLGLSQSPPERATRYVIVRHDGVEMALLVDGVTDLINLTSNDFKPVPAGLHAQQSRFLQAVTSLEPGHIPMALLDIQAIITALRDGGS